MSRGKRDVVATVRTQREGIDQGRALARAEKAELIWQGRDGKIKGRSSFGNDPRGRG